MNVAPPYELNYFYKYEPSRPLEEIEGEILDLENQIQGMLREVLV